MTFKFMVVVFSCFVVISAYIIEPRIIGGENTFSNEFPFIASFRFEHSYNCAGSIITNRHILTAAHCMINGTSDLSVYSVFVGSNIFTKGRKVEIESIKVHEKYIGKPDSWKNDLAIIKLKEVLDVSDSVKIINIRRSALNGYENVTAAGWGLTLQPASFIPNLQQKLTATELPYEKCKNYWDAVVPSHLCFWNGENIMKGICRGDSGGPLIFENELVGVLSWTSTDCAEGKPDVAVRLAPHFLEWINTNLS